MAEGAVLRESGGFVRRVVGSVEVGLVAVPAGPAGQAVVVVEVARRALLGGVEAQQFEPGGGVVERGAGPIRGGVAGSAGLRKAGCCVVGTGGFLEIGQVTSHALLRRSRKHSIDVTLSARHGGMRSSQRESAQAVIERGALPVGGGVTTLATGGELTGLVIGIGRAIVVRQVASHALRRHPGEDSVRVALGALDGGVRPGQCEAGELRVVEAGARPGVDVVTALAGDGQLRRHVVQRCGSLIVLKVARHALRAQSGIDSGGRSMMAIVAHHRGVGANQRKPVAMLLNRRNSHPPGIDRVAALTVGSELPPMQVGVTLRAARRRRREYQVGVTALTSNPLVQAL